MRAPCSRCRRFDGRSPAFTLLEVALIVAIIGMMLLILVGYLFAPKDKGPLPPVAETTPIPSSPPPVFPAPPKPLRIPTPAMAPASASLPAATPGLPTAPAATPLSPDFR
jgi:hypothetical protein